MTDLSMTPAAAVDGATEPAAEGWFPTKVAILGAGIMGAGVAQLVAQHGVSAALYDVSDSALERGLDQISVSARRVERAGGRPTSDVMAAITPVTNLTDAVVGADLVIEAAPEVLDVKLRLLEEVDELVGHEAVLGTNTSQLSITALAAATTRPENVVGIHFFNPPPVMPLVEIIPGMDTADETVARAVAFCAAMGKQTTISRDVQGFIASRGNLALALECYRMFEEGVATAEDIDRTFRLGFGHPMGPLELADYVGLDTILNVAEAMHEAYGDRFRPPLVLRRLVAAGRLGRKSGIGFHDYADAQRRLRG